MKIREALTFDDVALIPAKSSVLPKDVNTSSSVTNLIDLEVPLLSAAMDTVTESTMAIAMAQVGGLGVIHRNLEPQQQADEVHKVKKFESGMIVNPVTMNDTGTLSDALEIMRSNNISGIPVLDQNSKRLVGVVTNRDVRFANQLDQPIRELMTKKPLVTVQEGIKTVEAKRLLHQHRIEKLLVVDKQGCCTGLITVKDIEKSKLFPSACKDEKGRLRVAAATTVGDTGIYRAEMLIDAGVDIIVVDTAHGHSDSVPLTVKEIKKKSNHTQILAGNVATSEAAESLIDSGADAIKVGIGPGSICTTRIVAGVGVPQLTAIMDVVNICKKTNIPVIADGGIKYSGDLAKAIAAGADAVMIGSLFSGTDEAPGEIFYYQGRSYKSYRGMGSVAAMARGSADRYFQEEIKDYNKMVPEGIEGRVPYKGSVHGVIHQLIGGLRSAMGYTGAKNIFDLQENSKFCRVTNSGLKESHVHGVSITQESPNYPGNMA
tara:strand:+ start:86 stop:1552 length:1467 start_codon:yes stop_codon:yes gene_type:complete